MNALDSEKNIWVKASHLNNKEAVASRFVHDSIIANLQVGTGSIWQQTGCQLHCNCTFRGGLQQVERTKLHPTHGKAVKHSLWRSDWAGWVACKHTLSRTATCGYFVLYRELLFDVFNCGLKSPCPSRSFIFYCFNSLQKRRDICYHHLKERGAKTKKMWFLPSIFQRQQGIKQGKLLLTAPKGLREPYVLGD